jgi:hypothetical protein
MSRSALLVAGLLLAFTAMVLWWVGREDREETGGGDRQASSSSGAAAGDQSNAPDQTPAPTRPVSPSALPAATPPQIATRDELVNVLRSRGLDADALLRRAQEWRIARGYFGSNPLTGLAVENSPAANYADLDIATLRSLASANDLGALQALAAGLKATNPDESLATWQRAIRLGSTAAAVEAGEVAKAMPPAEGRDPRVDALTYGLAALRDAGPAAADAGQLIWITATARQMNRDQVDQACARSLAILAELSSGQSAQGIPRQTSPPVFVTERGIYDQLPCRNTAAPIVPPATATNCAVSEARDAISRPVDLWVCPGN